VFGPQGGLPHGCAAGRRDQSFELAAVRQATMPPAMAAAATGLAATSTCVPSGGQQAVSVQR
jgi:hypothetical protein